MNTKNIFRIFALCGLVFLPLRLMASSEGRKICIDKGWKFHYGAAREAISPDFDDASWRTLDLPHDWSVETEAAEAAGDNIGPFSKNNPGGSATGQTVGGEGWYRKSFTLTDADKAQRITLYFEGAYAQSEYWINGIKVYFNAYGYSSFRFDITDYCKPAGEENVLTVRVVNEGKNTRWYAGSGIYRHVWMLKTPQTYLDTWETAITTQSLTDEMAEINVATTAFNRTNISKDMRTAVHIITPDGKTVVASDTVATTINANDEADASLTFRIAWPQVWDLETPNLYTACLGLLDEEGKAIDRIDIPFGIRTVEFNAEKGFLLNAESCRHF